MWRISHPSSCVFSFDSRLVLIKDTAGVLYLADLTVDDPQPRVLPHHRTEGPAPVFTRDGRAIIDGCWDGHLDVLSVPAGELVSSRSWPEDMILDIHLLEDEAFLVLHSPRATDRDSSPPPDYFSLWASPLAAAPESECRPNLDFGRDSAISPDGKSVLLVHGAPPETLSLIDLATGAVVRSIEVSSGGTGSDIEWHSSGVIVCVAEDGFLFLDPELQVLASVEIAYACAASVSEDGEWFALGSWEDGRVISRSALGLPPA